MSRYDTNLAGEFYALACLHRLGVTANLTLGNKKGVDIVVARKAGDAVTVEVKALAGKDYWPAQNLSAVKPRPSLRRARELRRQDQRPGDAATERVGHPVR